MADSQNADVIDYVSEETAAAPTRAPVSAGTAVVVWIALSLLGWAAIAGAVAVFIA